MNRLRLLFGVVVCVCVAGCSGSKFDSEVSGTVKLDGQPIGPGVVIFSNSDGKTNPARGNIQPDGAYELMTSRDVGLPAGKYKVGVQIVEIPTDLAPGQRDMRPTKSRIPERYSDTSNSGFEFDVVAGSNTIDIEMTSDNASARRE